MDIKENFTPETITAMADALLLVPDRLPDGIDEDLSTLRQMLEKAVQGKEHAEPVPPAYGKSACPAVEETTDENILHLRQDAAIPEKTRMLALSARAREEGDYITVPQVVRAQTGGDHA